MTKPTKCAPSDSDQPEHQCNLSIYEGYRNVPKFLDRQVWATSVDPDQTALTIL